MKRKGVATEVTVGIFVIVVLATLLSVVVLLTSKSEVFKKTYILQTVLGNVGGLIEGSDVMLSGITVGYVKNMEFIKVEGKPKVSITFSVTTEAAERIPKNSKATLETMGLLGKKYMSIIPGDFETGTVADGDVLEGVDPIELTQALTELGGVIDNIVEAAQAMRNLLMSLQGEGPKTDLAETIASLKKIAERVEKGPGALHALIYDPKREMIVADLGLTAQNLRMITDQVRAGGGTLHELIYGTEGEMLVQNLASASKALEEIIRSVKEEKGLLHQLIYEEERGEIVSNLAATTNNLKEISDMIKSGEGTVGALIVDPSVYEDLKKITSELERNRMLKSFVRRLIKR